MSYESKDITDQFRRNEEGVWYNVNTRNPADKIMQDLLDKFEREMGVRPEDGKGILFSKKTGDMSVAKDLPKVSTTGEKVSSAFDKNLREKFGDLFPDLMKGLSGLFVKNIVPAKSTTEDATLDEDLDDSRPTDATPEETEAEIKKLVDDLVIVFDFAIDKLSSIDKGIHELVTYFKSEEKEEDTAEAELEKEKTKENKENVHATKEEAVSKLVARGEALESQTILGKAGKKGSEDFRLSLGSKLPGLGLISNAFDPSKIGTDADPLKNKIKDAETSLTDMAVQTYAFAQAVRLAIIPLALMSAKIVAVTAALAATAAAATYVSDKLGISEWVGENILGMSKEDAEKSVKDRTEFMEDGLDNLLGVERVNKKDGSLDWKKTYGFENPIEAVGDLGASLGDAAGDYLFKGEGPLAPTGKDFKPRAADAVKKPAATPVPAPPIQPQTTNINKATQEIKKAEMKKTNATSSFAQQVINNNNNSKTSSTTVIIGGSRGALDFALA